MNQLIRCDWANASEAETQYHDHEWGVPCHDDQKLFEMLTLESAQAGLSWSTILNKRDGYRQAFANFDIQLVAAFNEADVARLLQNERIVRNQQKIRATIHNASRVLAMQAQHGSFDHYIWSFVDQKPVLNQYEHRSEVPAKTDISDRMSKQLKADGFKFIGSTICYAFMQATGMVNDHIVTCFRHPQV